MSEDEDKYTVHLYRSDRSFLEAEELRMMQERFEETARLERPSVADVVTELLAELRGLRSRVEVLEDIERACTCGAGGRVDAAREDAELE